MVAWPEERGSRTGEECGDKGTKQTREKPCLDQ